MADDHDSGLVLAVSRHAVEVWIPEHGVVRCRLHGRYRSESLRGEGVVVGDRALLGPVPRPPSPGAPPPPRSVVGIAPRSTALRRLLRSRADDRAHAEQVVAANVDVCLVAQAWRDPAFRPASADRLIGIARASGIPAALVINKAEVVPPAEVERALAPYASLGLPTFAVSALTRLGLQALAAFCAGRTVVLLGPSGVGKSALTAALAEGPGPATGAVSTARLRRGRGRHTTVAARVFPLRAGGMIIDTPGIRSLGLPRGASAEDAFPEVAALARECRFADCRHRDEPGCAVRAAVAAGKLPVRAYQGYLRVVADQADRPTGRGYSHPKGRRRRGGQVRDLPPPE